MKLLEKCTPTFKGFWFILESCMSAAFSDKESMQECWRDYVMGRCQLWTVGGEGFIIVSFFEKNLPYSFPQRYMFVRYGAGRKFYTQENIQLLNQLALENDCQYIVCKTVSKAVARLLEKVGFKYWKKDGSETYLKRGIEYGRTFA